jgi:hypothetical protein
MGVSREASGSHKRLSDGKKRRRNSLLRIFSVGIGFEATAAARNRTPSSRWTNMSGEDYAGNRLTRKLIDLSGVK